MPRRRRKNDALPLPFLVTFVFLGVVLLNPRWFWPLLVIGLIASGLFIWYKVNAAQRKRQAALKLQDLQALTPRELELHVATVVGSLPGWKAEATRSSSDQGADVIATSPAGVKIAVQVKHYRSPVGNKAVQEIVASKAFYKAEHAVVVTSGPGYTRSAVELARANNVRLWQAADLFALQALAVRQQKPDPRILPG